MMAKVETAYLTKRKISAGISALIAFSGILNTALTSAKNHNTENYYDEIFFTKHGEKHRYGRKNTTGNGLKCFYQTHFPIKEKYISHKIQLTLSIFGYAIRRQRL